MRRKGTVQKACGIRAGSSKYSGQYDVKGLNLYARAQRPLIRLQRLNYGPSSLSRCFGHLRVDHGATNSEVRCDLEAQLPAASEDAAIESVVCTRKRYFVVLDVFKAL